MVEAAADIHGHAVAQGQVSRENRAARRQPESLDQLRRIRHLHLHLFHGGECPGLELLHVFPRVHPQDVFVRGGLGRDEIGGLGHAGLQQPLVDQPVFLGGENMRTDGQIVVVAVDQLEWQHDRSG